MKTATTSDRDGLLPSRVYRPGSGFESPTDSSLLQRRLGHLPPTDAIDRHKRRHDFGDVLEAAKTRTSATTMRLMSLRTGETLAGYRILRLLGPGGMGEVYLVQHPRLPRQDALKVLRPDVSSDTSFRERFIREADLAAGLRH